LRFESTIPFGARKRSIYSKSINQYTEAFTKYSIETACNVVNLQATNSYHQSELSIIKNKNYEF
jgi:hypothetical protein